MAPRRSADPADLEEAWRFVDEWTTPDVSPLISSDEEEAILEPEVIINEDPVLAATGGEEEMDQVGSTPVPAEGPTDESEGKQQQHQVCKKFYITNTK